uniref:Uncharacterized protein n=1 Tax=Arundo donax TaxID=35708 RepID=A0A0A9BA60_ARUDO
MIVAENPYLNQRTFCHRRTY